MSAPTKAQTADAAKVLALAALTDPYFPRPDPNMARAWAAVFAIDRLQLPDMLEAVIRHYHESDQRLTPAATVRHAKTVRRDRAAHESPEARADRIDARLDSKIRELAQAKAIPA